MEIIPQGNSLSRVYSFSVYMKITLNFLQLFIMIGIFNKKSFDFYINVVEYMGDPLL